MEALIKSAIAALARVGAADAIVHAAGRFAKATLCAVIAAILVTASIACAVTALWIWEVPRLGPAAAPLVVAGVLLALCLAVLALMQHILRSRPVPSASDASAEMLLAEAVRLFKDHKGAILMAALVAGLVAGRDEK
jgi:hypothetical protein